MTPQSFERLTNGPVCCQLDYAVLRIGGADARDFLHSQCVSHLQRIDPAAGTRTAWCTAQGRVSFLFWLLPEPAGFLLLVPASEAARCIKRLRMFILRAQVTVEDLSATHVVQGLSLPDGKPVPGWSERLPAARHAVTDPAPGLRAMRMQCGGRFLLVGEGAALGRWLLDRGVPAVDSGSWRYLDILDGRVEITGASVEAYLPQQINLDFEGVLAFDKGCYPGQEIIARLKYRGEVKSRLLIGRTEAEVVAGEKLAPTPQAPTGGTVLASTRDPMGWTHLLAVADLGALESGLMTALPPPRVVHFRRPPEWQD